MRTLVLLVIFLVLVIHLFTRDGLQGLTFDPELIEQRTIGLVTGSAEVVEDAADWVGEQADETGDAIQDEAQENEGAQQNGQQGGDAGTGGEQTGGQQ